MKSLQQKQLTQKNLLIWVKQQEKPNQINDVLGTQPQNAYFTPNKRNDPNSSV